VPSPLEIPEIRQKGKGITRRWEWKFPPDGTWRDMNQDLARKEIKTYRDVAVTVESGPDPTYGAYGIDTTLDPFEAVPFQPQVAPYTAFQNYFQHAIPSDQPTQIEEIELGEIVDFDALIEKTDILPARLKNISVPYMLMLSGLWAGVTGYDSEEGIYEPWGAWNLDDVEGHVATEDFIKESLGIITEDLAETYGWERVSDNRGYQINWAEDPQAVAAFIVQSQDDVRKGITHTAYDSRANISKDLYTALGIDKITKSEDLIKDAPDTTLQREVIAEYGSGDMGHLDALKAQQGAPGSKVEKRDGNWVVTVPPGWNGFANLTTLNEWLEESGLNPKEWEGEPNQFGRFSIKRIPAAISGTWDTEAEAKEWLRTSGDTRAPDTWADDGSGGFAKIPGKKIGPENYEVVPFKGKWVIREKAAVAAVVGHATVEAARAAVRVALGLGEDAELPEYEFPVGPDGFVQTVYKGKPEGYASAALAEAAVIAAVGVDKAGEYEFPMGKDGQVHAVYKGKAAPGLQYSTGTTRDPITGDITPGVPGDMFKPTLTTDPTGRTIGLEAAGTFQDFGYGMAGDITQEELAGYQPPYRSLEMIVAKAIEQGNWELARGVQAFMDRPTERDLLDYAAQYAEAPADLAVLSAIARGEQMVQPAVPLPEGMGTAMGQPTRIGPPGEVYTRAYKSFVDSMNQGFVPDEEELRQLFDPKNDPAYIATQELATKYESQIDTLRDQIAEANKTSTERIESTQTATLNLMTGLFEGTLDSFKEVMKKSTSMKDAEIERLIAESDALRTSIYDGDQEIATGDARDAGGAFASAMNVGDEDTFIEPAMDGDEFADPASVYSGSVAAGGIGLAAKGGRKVAMSGGGNADKVEKFFGGMDDQQKAFVNQWEGGIWSFAQSAQNIDEMRTNINFHLANAADPEIDMGRPAQAISTIQDPALNETLESGLETLAEGGVVQGPTMALLGEEEPEFIVPFSKVDEFKRGLLPLGQPRQTQMGGAVAKFEDSIPRFANGGLVTGPRFGGVTASELERYKGTREYVTPGTLAELELGAEGQYGADGISRAPSIHASDFQSLLERYAPSPGYGAVTQEANLANIPEYELRQRLGASEFAGTNPAQHPPGIQQLMAGRPIARPRSLMTAANMPIPSGQALRNMLPSELDYYQKMGRMAGIPQEEIGREMRSAMPGGTRRTPFRMGARRVRQA
jgi:hypothetical protein